MRCAIYLRVSKSDDSQTTENQRTPLEKFVTEQHWDIFKIYEDYDSGGKGAEGKRGRAQFAQMLEDAHKRKFDVLVFWSLDRLTREGAFKTLSYLEMLSDWGVAYTSFTERYLDTCGIFKEAVISILATIAKQERVRISERVKAGMQRARQRGTHIGPPFKARSQVILDDFRRAMKVYNNRELCARFKISRSTMHVIKRQIAAIETHEQLSGHSAGLPIPEKDVKHIGRP